MCLELQARSQSYLFVSVRLCVRVNVCDRVHRSMNFLAHNSVYTVCSNLVSL